MNTSSGKHKQAVRLVVRLLPPGLTQEQFEAQITQYTTQWHLVNNYYYVTGAYPEKPYELPTYSRAYFVVPDAEIATKIQAELRAKAFSDGELNGASVPIIGKALYENKEYAAVPRAILKERKKKKTIEQLAQFQQFVAFLDGKTESFLLKPPKKPKKPKAKNQKADQKTKSKDPEKAKDTNDRAKKPKKKSKKPKNAKDKDGQAPQDPSDAKPVEKKKKKKKKKSMTVQNDAPGTTKQEKTAPQPNEDVGSVDKTNQSNQNAAKGENDTKAPKKNQKRKPKKKKANAPGNSTSSPQTPSAPQPQTTNAAS